MTISEREVEQAKASGGRTVQLDPPGIESLRLGPYHNPVTGQEFRLPASPSHIMWYMTGRKYGNKPLIYGPASEELRAKWLETKAKRVGAEQEFMPEVKKQLEEAEADATNQLLVVVQQLQKQVSDLQAQMSGVVPAQERTVTEEKEEEAPIEPRQLTLFE
ncbi:hypothetical protein LCGC14_1242560 [marine sediment metagenome]|uniref:Uncharacterized protein n=1 Tax=marine sediment metagenome TaxID=412755 RepID=A0A0F9L5E9_9ZZZZ